jgi:PAS domain S-box-containing protein
MGKRVRILLVEDDEIDRQAVQRYIAKEKLPYKLDIASSGTEAVAALQADGYDIILLDYDLKTSTGLDLLPYTGDTPVIFVTGSGTEEIAVEAIRLGASDYLVKDPERNYLAVLPVTIRTVLERKQSERSLRLYERIVDAAGELMAYLDRKLNFQAVNTVFLKAHNIDRKTILGKSVEELKNASLFQEIDKNKFQRCLAGVKIHDESWFEYPGLGRRYMDVNYLPFFESDGSVSGVLVVAHDNTIRKRSEEERLELEAHVQQVQKFESLNVMAGSIAHSFNNLLMGVLGNLELANSYLDKDSPALHNIENADKAAKRVAELSKLMLTYVGQAKGDTQKIDLTLTVHEMMGMLEASVPKHTNLVFSTSTDSILMEGDPSQVQMVIMNLVTNAAESIPDSGGTITIATSRRFCIEADFHGPFKEQELPDGDYVVLEVTDSGCGMDEEILTKAFDPFFTTRFKGRGMGLAAVLGVARAYKGTVALHSQPDKGTQATVLFPAAASELKTIILPLNEEERWQGTGTVLIADDEEMVLAVGQEMLEELGYYVLTARDGVEAVALYEEYIDEVVCVILDMTMPRMSGEEAFQIIRERKQDVPVIICSGYTEEQVTKRFMDKLPAPFLGKPFKLPELMAKLKETLSGKK